MSIFDRYIGIYYSGAETRPDCHYWTSAELRAKEKKNILRLCVPVLIRTTSL
jgi:hypothetical protein